MDELSKIEILAKSFAEGVQRKLKSILAENCVYKSDYSNKEITGASEIIDRMNYVNSNITDDSRYTFEIVNIRGYLQDDVTIDDLKDSEANYVSEEAILLYQYQSEKPAALVICEINSDAQISHIYLCRDKSKINLHFYGEEIEQDSPDDIPKTVDEYNVDKSIYIWRKANTYVRTGFTDKGYSISETKIYDDCVAYRCTRYGEDYTLFMFAFGKEQIIEMSGEYCSKYVQEDFAKDSTILISYIHVDRYMDGEKVRYNVECCNGDNKEPDLWVLKNVNNKWILEYLLPDRVRDEMQLFKYAFNHNDFDLYKCIITNNNPSITTEDGTFLNDGFYQYLYQLHEKYGDMQVGYVRLSDVIYVVVPYLDGLGFIEWDKDEENSKMCSFACHPFDGDEPEVKEFIEIKQWLSDEWIENIPKLIKAEPLSTVATERFAIKLEYDNGDCKKFVFPLSEEQEKMEVISIDNHVFSDGIWKSGYVVESHESSIKSYPDGGPAVVFKNEYAIPGVVGYLLGENYSEPKKINSVVYEDDNIRLTKAWSWNARGIYEDKETGVLKVLLSGMAFNWNGKSTFGSIEGERITSLSFDHISDFQEDLSAVLKHGYGYGFVDKDMNFVIPMKYNRSEDFQDGIAKVQDDDEKWLFVDKNGNEIRPEIINGIEEYIEVGDFSEGMSRVSVMRPRLAYHSDYSDIAGKWGFIDETGKLVITPQYIYANDFENGIAFVAKGEWTRDKKWDNQYRTDCDWTEVELWGAIDKDGNEVIPFIFDEIKYFWDDDSMFMAHHGGWESGKWGVIDRKGNWLAEPIFEDIEYENRNGLISFYKTDKWDDPDNVPMGIYDVENKRVVFEPQFLEISYMDDGDICVEKYSEELHRNIQVIMDLEGNERFKSEYSHISDWKEPYEVEIRDSDGSKEGLIDHDGNIVFPLRDDLAIGAFRKGSKYIVFEKDGKQGLLDYDNNVVVPAIYEHISTVKDSLIHENRGYAETHMEALYTLDGKTIIPPIYRHMEWCKDGKHLICQGNEGCDVYILEKLN